MPTAGTICRVAVGQAGVVSVQPTVGIVDRGPPLAGTRSLIQAELQAIVVTNGTWLRRARRAERLSNPRARGRTVQQVAKRGARVAYVKAQIVGDADVLDSPVQALARVPGSQPPVRRDGPIDASHELVLLHWLDLGVHARVRGVDDVFAQVQLFDEPTDGHARRGTRPRPATMSAGSGRSDLSKGGIIHGIDTVAPVIPPERTPWQAVFHDVKELAIAGIDLDLAVVKQVVGAANAWRDFVKEAEAYMVSTRAIRRQKLLVKAHAQIQR